MFILLEPGMEIKIGDTAYVNEKWYPVDPYTTGKWYTDMHSPMRRKISSIEELFASYNSEYVSPVAKCCECAKWFKDHNLNINVCPVCGADL